MYAKLFGSILISSIWSEDLETRVLWITMLALANQRGEIFGSPAGLARMANLTIPAVERGLEKFLAPDPHSADLAIHPENAGRRIELIPGGWRLINYERYRELQKAEDRREQNRQHQQAWRDRQKGRLTVAKVTVRKRKEMSSSVNEREPSEAEAVSEADTGTTADAVVPGDGTAGLPKVTGITVPLQAAAEVQLWIDSHFENQEVRHQWERRVASWQDGLDMPQGRPASIEQIARAMRDWPANREPTPKALRAFVHGIKREEADPRNLAEPGEDPHSFTAIAKRMARGEVVPEGGRNGRTQHSR